MPVTLKTTEDIQKIAAGGAIMNRLLKSLAEMAKPGVSTYELDRYAEAEILKVGGKPAFKGYGDKKNPFPATLCTSINSMVVHGIPEKTAILKDGDIISLDIGMEYMGRYTDTAITVPVGSVTGKVRSLLDAAKMALLAGIKQAVAGNRIGDIAHATQVAVEAAGFEVVRDLVGHGVGFSVHEEPQVPCYGKPHTGPKLLEGMVLAIEPMVVMGSYILQVEPDGWGISTRDGSLAAHFEHTVAITKSGPKILT